MDLFERNVAVYNVVAEMCMHPRAQSVWHFINVCKRDDMHCRASLSIKAAEFNVLADNFVVCKLISMNISLLASYRLGGSSSFDRNRMNSIPNMLCVEE